GAPLRAGAGGGQDPTHRRARHARSRVRRPGPRHGDGARAGGRRRRVQLLRLRGDERRARARPRMREAVAISGAGAVTSLDVALASLPEGVRARATRAERVTQLVLLAAGRALVAAGGEPLDDDLGHWLGAGGPGPGRGPAEGAAVVALERTELARARGRAVLGTVEGVAAGFEPEPAGARAGEGLAAAVATALEEAGVAPSEIRALVSAAPPALADLESRALGGVEPRTVVRPKDALGETFGAAGALGVLAALAEAPPGAALLVLDVCASGHVAALVARAGGGPVGS